MMNRRAERFLNIINDNNNNIIFLCGFMYNCFKNINHNQLFNDMKEFENNIKVNNFKIVFYIINNEDFELIIPDVYNNLKNFIFTKYVKNIIVDKNYGDPKDFINLLKEYKLV